MAYTTSDAEVIFKVSPQTIRNWAREFARYLSVNANPDEGRTRIFTEEDMQVLDLVAQMKSQGKQYEDIHAALMAGERGNRPGYSSDEVRALVTGEVERRLHMEIQVLKRQLEIAERKLEAAEHTNDENIRMQALLETSNHRIDDLSTQLKSAQDELRRLEREAGQAYYRGRLDEAKNREPEDEG